MEGGGVDGCPKWITDNKDAGLERNEFSGDWGDQRWLPGGGRGREE